MISRDESFEWLWNRIIEINDKYKPYWRNWNLAMLGNGMGKEVGEIQDIISIWLGGGTNKKIMPTKHKAITEVVDVFVYGIMFLETINIEYATFTEAFKQKLGIIEKRLIDAQEKTIDVLEKAMK